MEILKRTKMAAKIDAEIARLKQKIKNTTFLDENGCLIWEGGLDRRHKYGRIWANMPIASSSNITRCGKSVEVHRISYLIYSGMFHNGLESGLEVSHLCHNTICCNFYHLSLEPNTVNQDRQHCFHQNLRTYLPPAKLIIVQSPIVIPDTYSLLFVTYSTIKKSNFKALVFKK
jgi:hypothetical protein